MKAIWNLIKDVTSEVTILIHFNLSGYYPAIGGGIGWATFYLYIFTERPVVGYDLTTGQVWLGPLYWYRWKRVRV